MLSIKGGRMQFIERGRRLFIKRGGRPFIKGRRRLFVDLRVGQCGGKEELGKNNEFLHWEIQNSQWDLTVVCQF